MSEMYKSVNKSEAFNDHVFASIGDSERSRRLQINFNAWTEYYKRRDEIVRARKVSLELLCKQMQKIVEEAEELLRSKYDECEWNDYFDRERWSADQELEKMNGGVTKIKKLMKEKGWTKHQALMVLQPDIDKQKRSDLHKIALGVTEKVLKGEKLSEIPDSRLLSDFKSELEECVRNSEWDVFLEEKDFEEAWTEKPTSRGR